MRILSIDLFVAACLLTPSPLPGAWETSGDWNVQSETSLSARHGAAATAWNPGLAPGRTWCVKADIKIRRAPGALVGTAQLVFADSRRGPQVVVHVRRRGGGLSMLEVETPGRPRSRPILTSGWIPGDDESFSLRICQVGQSLKVVLYGDKYISYAEQTPEIPAALLDASVIFGLAADAADVDFSAVQLESPWTEPGHYEAQAEAAVGDLLAHFWKGGLDRGSIVPTSHGYPAENIPNIRGGLWERAMMAFALDTLYRATGDATLSRRLQAEWARLKRLYTVEELEAAGGPLHPACDDTGWDVLYYLVLRYYGGSWSGPPSGPGSRWCMVGSRAEQITTSSSSVNMIAAAALVERQRAQGDKASK